MKKIIAIFLSCFLITSLALAAESAKDLMKQVDKKFSEATKSSVYTPKKKLNVDEIGQVKELRKNAEVALKSGSEEESTKLLREALKILE